jgi:hypothetical protein
MRLKSKIQLHASRQLIRLMICAASIWLSTLTPFLHAQAKPNNPNNNSNNNFNNPNINNGNVFDLGGLNNYQAYEDDIILESSKEAAKGSSDLMHPSAANRRATQRLLLETQLPDLKQLQQCDDLLIATTQEAINELMILQAQKKLYQEVERNEVLYHWCFYYTVQSFEHRLDATRLALKADFFAKYMKALFVLARALDYYYESPTYFGYIRRRHIEWSRHHFGKSLVPISPPLGDENRIVPQLDPKAAGVFK